MAMRLMAKRVSTRSHLTSCRMLVSVGKKPCFQLLNDTKAVIANNNRFFSTAPKAKPSILEEFLGWVREKQSIEKREIKAELSSRGLEIWVNAAGFGKEDMQLEIENGDLMINGVVKDRRGRTVRIKERMRITDFPFKFDPENFLAETRNGLLKVRFPFSENAEDQNKKGRYRVKWI